jgi:hypothetical protein
VFAQYVGVDPECHRWVGMAEPCSHDVYWDTSQEQGRGMQVAKIMQAGMR